MLHRFQGLFTVHIKGLTFYNGFRYATDIHLGTNVILQYTYHLKLNLKGPPTCLQILSLHIQFK